MSYQLGRHLLLELHDCHGDLLSDVAAIEQHMVEAAHKAGATIINTTFHHFAPAGVSGVVVIQESHLSIHTWPEHRFAAIDIFTCGTEVDPWKAGAYLKRALQSRRGEAREYPRGELPEPVQRPASHPAAISDPQRNLWFTERRTNLALSLRHAGVVFETQSPFQKIQILDTYGYGRMLVLDGRVMCTERDECVYHEMIVHVPALTHGNPNSALVIGGGDGGAVRELLRHQSIQRITLVEIDAQVIAAARTHLPTMASGFDDERVTVHIQDGAEFLTQTEDASFDLILIDVPDTADTTSELFTQDFYGQVLRCMTPNGIMVAQLAPPFLFDATFAQIIRNQGQVFGKDRIHPYIAFIPTYATGMLCFALATKATCHPESAFDNAAAQAFCTQHHLQYYTPQIHASCFAIPPLMRSHFSEA